MFAMDWHKYYNWAKPVPVLIGFALKGKNGTEYQTRNLQVKRKFQLTQTTQYGLQSGIMYVQNVCACLALLVCAQVIMQASMTDAMMERMAN